MSDQGPYPPPGGPPPPGAVPPPEAPRPWYPQQQPPYPPQGYPQQGYPQQPGWPPQGPPGYPQPGYAPPGYPPMMVAAHKPGAIPIRPLRLGDMFDGAFKIIRINPGATVGSAVLVTAVAMAIPLLITGVLASFVDFSYSTSSSGNGSDVTLVAGSVLQAIGLIFVTGMVTHVVSAAALGGRLSLGGAWAATAGKRWKLVGLTGFLFTAILVYAAVVVGLIAVLAVTLSSPLDVLLAIPLGLAGVAGLVFFWVRIYYLAVPPLVLENVGVFGALGRAWTLTAGQFWRTCGIGLLTVMITQVIGTIITIPFAVVGLIATFGAGDGDTGLMLFLITNAVATVASSAFSAPFTASVTALQYVDQRMRKEGYDVELLSRAGLA